MRNPDAFSRSHLLVLPALFMVVGCGDGHPSSTRTDADVTLGDGGPLRDAGAGDMAVATDAATDLGAPDPDAGVSGDVGAAPDQDTVVDPDQGSGTNPTCAASTCGPHETCVGGTCECNPGHVAPSCVSCERGWHADESGDCQNIANCDGSNPCYGHGTNCRYSQAIGGDVCTCNPGYAGDLCSACAYGYERDAQDRCVVALSCEPDPCGDHGRCESEPEVVCICDEGWTDPHCDWCASGYHREGDDCVPNVPCEPESCDFHGTCTDYTGVPRCSCHTGYTGDSCQQCTSAYRELPNGVCVKRLTCAGDAPCYRSEQCDDSSGDAVCTCGDAYVGERCDACAPGYHNEFGACVPDTSCIPGSTCANRGDCYVGTNGPFCICDWGYDGDHCDACDPGFVKIEGWCRACGPVRLAMDDLFGYVQPSTCAVAGEGDSPVHYQGVEIFNAYTTTNPGIGECHANDAPFASNWLRLMTRGGYPPYIVFDHPVVSVSFQYAGVNEAGQVDVYADGALLTTLDPPLGSVATIDLTFPTPITVLMFDARQTSYYLGLDELVYVPAVCAE